MSFAPHIFAMAGCALFVGAMAWAAVSDFTTRRIANRLTVGLAIAYAVFGPLGGLGVADLGFGVLAGAGTLALGVAAFAAGWVGAGDSKLAAASALWLGPALAIQYLVWTALIGGVMAMAIVVFRAFPLPRFLGRRRWARLLHVKGVGAPYGVALALAGAMLLPESPIVRLAAP
jgi:prepilin peptidase CpaA